MVPVDEPGRLTVTHLRHISELQSSRWQFAVARMALHRSWNVRDVEKEVRRIKAGKGQSDPKAYLAPFLEDLLVRGRLGFLFWWGLGFRSWRRVLRPLGRRDAGRVPSPWRCRAWASETTWAGSPPSRRCP